MVPQNLPEYSSMPENAKFEEIIKSYIDYFSSKSKDRTKFWAIEYINTITSDDPEKAWPFIIALIKASSNDQILAMIAAGPLEDILRKHAIAFIDRVLASSRQDPKFRRCLRAVYGHAIDKSIRSRIEEEVKSIPPY